MPKKLKSIRLDEETILKPLERIAEKEHRDFTNVVEVALLEYIRKKSK